MKKSRLADTDVRTNVILPSGLHKKVQAASRKRGISFAQFVREALVREVEIDPLKDPFFNLPSIDAKNAPRDLAINHDHYLYGAKKR